MRTAADKRTNDRRLGCLRLFLVAAATAGLVGLGIGVAYLNRPAVGRPCSVPNATGGTMSCTPALNGNREAVWRYVAER
ncbi:MULTISPECIES: hypothetical protein [Mycobacterium]|uniref:hypothetical protein n=1 Tax=Mycobacterium TaxID=1763 RepID=UPI001CDA4105|nr:MULTISPECIES: hypothetical protein [Mycobacterium]MCA2242393.1 hypothetical protein [Mycobacterium sp. WUMAC-067]MCA2313778.1 hypothetical protein [Mycobacterium sp. WUMAC-025]MEE3755115.1 hypothetical protein [Mycobacterium intracellulare]